MASVNWNYAPGERPMGMLSAQPFIEQFRNNKNLLYTCALKLAASDSKLSQPLLDRLFVVRDKLNIVVNVYYEDDAFVTQHTETIELKVIIDDLIVWGNDFRRLMALVNPDDYRKVNAENAFAKFAQTLVQTVRKLAC